MARVNEEQEIAERYSLNSLLNSAMHVLTFLSTTLAAACVLSYTKQTDNLTALKLSGLCIGLCLTATVLSLLAYYVYRAESDQEFNYPSSQSKLFGLNGFLGAAFGCATVAICL